MPNKFVQTIVNQVQETISKIVGVVNEKNTIIACSDLTQIGSVKKIEIPNNIELKNVFTDESYTYKIFNFQPNLQYIIFVEGVDEISTQYVNIVAIMLKNSKKYYDEKHNKNDFIKNIALSNILPSDVYTKAREFNLKAEVNRVIFLVKVDYNDNIRTYEILNSCFIKKNKDFIFNVSSREIALVKEFDNYVLDSANIKKIATKIFETLKTKIKSKIVVGFSSRFDNIRKLEQSFKEANVALNVGEIFGDSEKIVDYNNLGICRIIYQLPTTLCETFLKEVFKKVPLESLDAETFTTIYTFFSNNLNVSETSKKLFIHRNTLVYRLEKIKKLTGLDIRKFEDAIIFKISTMIQKYLKFSLNKA